MLKDIVNFFDKLEDKIRSHLSHWPIFYALIGAIGIVLVWKGIWETAGLFPVLYGPLSVMLGILILLLTGLLVSFFIGEGIIISGFKKEKKLVEKTEKEIANEESKITEIAMKLDHIEQELDELKK